MQYLNKEEGTYTSGDQRADTAFLVGASYARGDERRKVLTDVDVMICGDLSEARKGSFDNLTVEEYLKTLIDRIRGK